MKNKDLIDKLSQFNPEAEVTTPISEDIRISYISGDGENERTTNLIFIEPCDICDTCFFEEETYCSFHNEECSDVKNNCSYLSKEGYDGESRV